MIDASQDRRKFTRIEFDTGVTLCQDNQAYHTYVVDISLNGVLVKTPDDYVLKADKPIDISIILGEETEIQMSVVLVHSSSTLLGFRCINIDMESISHLRRLIELNLEEADAAERVLSELIELHH